MKKIFTILSIALLSMTFVSCEKEVKEVEENTNVTTTSYYCRHCMSRNIKVYYPPAAYSHLPPSYECLDCGKGGNLYPNKK